MTIFQTSVNTFLVVLIVYLGLKVFKSGDIVDACNSNEDGSKDKRFHVVYSMGFVIATLGWFFYIAEGLDLAIMIGSFIMHADHKQNQEENVSYGPYHECLAAHT